MHPHFNPFEPAPSPSDRLCDILDVNAAMTDPRRVPFIPEFNTKEGRIRFLERAMQRALEPEERRQIVREYLDLTNPEIQEPDF